MRRRVLVWLLVLSFPAAGMAHRLDEYLQAARISIELGYIDVEIDLTPGAAVANDVFAGIDRNHSGDISPAEGEAYAATVLRSLSLTVDGEMRPLSLESHTIPSLADMRRGEGVIRLSVRTVMPVSNGLHHLKFANGNRPDIGVYLVNVLIPENERIRIAGQSRDLLQREFDLHYTITDRASTLEAANQFWPPCLGLVLAGICLSALFRPR